MLVAVRACPIFCPGMDGSVTGTAILAAMTQAPAAAAAGAAKASEAVASVAAKASQAVGIGEHVCWGCDRGVPSPNRASADLAAATPPTPEQLEQERLIQEQRVQWAQTANVEALCALLTGQIYTGQVEKDGYEVVLHDPLPGRFARDA